MSVRTGLVKPDGTSALPRGVHDTASGPDAPIAPELEAKLKELLQGLDTRETKALFKLEVFFAGGPRKTRDVKGVIAVWTNGGFLNGGGDASVYLCPKEDVPGHPCMEPLDMQFVTAGKVVCTKCRRISATDDLIGQIVTEVSTQRWAQILVKLFHTLGCNADLRICIERESLHAASEVELSKDAGGEAYARVAAQREWITYPLAHIIADTASGAGLEQRFRAFLEA